MTLVELLISMFLGILLIGGAASIYLMTKRSYTEVERVSRVLENGYFAQRTMNSALRHVGYFGELSVADITENTSIAAVTGDCTGFAAAYNLNNYLFAAISNGSGEAIGCIDDAVPNTDVLVVKSVSPKPLIDSDNDNLIDDVVGTRTYIMANNVTGILFDGAATPPTIIEGGAVPNGRAWEYQFEVYYIRNAAIPQLSRKVLVWDGTDMAIVTEDLVGGVENIRMLYGQDIDLDSSIDRYDAADTVADWSRVSSIDIHLLVRSTEPDANYTDDKTYILGDLSITPNDNFHRIVLNSNISLRNPGLILRGRI